VNVNAAPIVCRVCRVKPADPAFRDLCIDCWYIEEIRRATRRHRIAVWGITALYIAMVWGMLWWGV